MAPKEGIEKHLKAHFFLQALAALVLTATELLLSSTRMLKGQAFNRNSNENS